jgi:hypothetical protein
MQKLQKSWFYKTFVFSAVPSLIDLELGGDIRTSTRNSVVCLFMFYGYKQMVRFGTILKKR